MEKRLIGSDGSLLAGLFGPPLVAAEILEAGKDYEILAIDETLSVFPTGAVVGYLFTAVGAEELATNDSCRLFTGTPLCDIQSWSLDFSKAEVKTTVLCDAHEVYRASKYDDITGNMEGIMTSGITDQPGSFLNQFASIVEQDGATMVITPKTDIEFYAKLVTDDTVEVGETSAYYFLPVVLTGFSASAGGDEAQTFSTPFRAGASDVGIVYYKNVNA